MINENIPTLFHFLLCALTITNKLSRPNIPAWFPPSPTLPITCSSTSTSQGTGKFTSMCASWPGSSHDSHIFRTSGLRQKLEQTHRTLSDGVILGDSGYPCRPFLLTPYLLADTPERERYQRAHTRTRVTIERTFGTWKRRFHVLHSEKQLGDTPMTEYINVIRSQMEVTSEVVSEGQTAYPCRSMLNRSKYYEYTVMRKCMMTPDLLDFFTNHTHYFCLLPSTMDLKELKYPSVQALMDFSKQNVHILCPGQMTELLHFIDSGGTALQEPNKISEMAAYLQMSYVGLMLQEDVLPRKCYKLVPGIEELGDKYHHCEAWFQRLAFMYMCILEPHVKSQNLKGKLTVPRVATQEFTKAVGNKACENLFKESGPYVRCLGHGSSVRANSELRQFPQEEFEQFFRFMTKLDFQNNSFEKLPPNFFENFTALETLNFSKNQLQEIPEGLKNLKELTLIDISMNQISKLPSDFDSLKTTLVSLNISDNPLQGMPKVIFQLIKLEELFAENIGTIQDLSEIKNLKELQTLNIGKNSISKLPEELGNLPLTDLDVSGVPWLKLTQYSLLGLRKAFNLNHVTMLIDYQEMTALFSKADVDESSTLMPDEIPSLNYDMLFPKYPRFGLANFSHDDTGGIPPMILRLKSLKRLVMRYHGIQVIPDDIKQLTELSELDLAFNPKLVSLSGELGGLPLKRLHLQECVALNTPPKEIVARGFMAVMGYLKRLQLGASPCKRTKLMLVGLGGAGKTSLVQSLMNLRYRAYIDYDDPITDGIDITKWEIPIDGENDKLTFSVWDFAGQSVYYNTHQFFLSNRAVYLLLWNVRQGYEHAGLDFWLSSIACHAPKAPIIIVGTHIDKVDKFKLPEEALKTRYPQIAGFHYVSSYTGNGIPALREVIVKQTLQQKYMGEKIPEAWLTLEKRLVQHREEKNVDILPFKSIDLIGNSCGIFDKVELIQAVQFLHDLGAVQFFDTDFLRTMVVIYPQWIIDVMACIVTVHEGAVKDGKLLMKDISKVWKDYPADLHPWLLRLTEEFDLTCPLADEEASIVPCLLPDEEPKYDWPHANPEKGILESMTVYKFQYLPAGLFNRAQVRINQYAKGALLWKKGSFMKKNNHIALILQTDDQEVVVRSQGFKPENFLFIVHEMFETLINESYAGVHYDFLIPCMDCLNMNVTNPSMISYQKIQRGLELNVPFVQCEKFFHILSIQELKNAMPSDKMSDMDNHLRNSVRELIDLTQENTISIFFIYSSKNVPNDKNKDKLVDPETVLSDLRTQDNFKISYTNKPESSDMEALSLSMKSATVIIIGMSDEFCDDPECRKLLLYVKDVLRKPVLLLLLGTTKKWQKSDLNMVFGTEVYVDMQNKQRYPHKIVELYDAIKKKADVKKKLKVDLPKCFISYCWTNSHDAIAKGSKSQEGALGWSGGDPREAKKWLDEKGIKSWIDVERVGGVGLFTSIADGLREAEVMIAFVSDEYVKSKNCVMEFRYGLTTLRIPVIVVVSGTGYEWERSEVGLLALGHACPKVNFQYANEPGYLDLLKLVQDKISTDHTGKDGNQDVATQRNQAFQEVLELTQKKFLRHMMKSITSNDAEPFPTLFVVDILNEQETKDWENETRKKILAKRNADAKSDQASTEKGENKDNKEVQEKAVIEEIDVSDVCKSKFCFRILCENPTGWHMVGSFIPFPLMDQAEEQELIDKSSAYLSRVFAICKHSNIGLECLISPEGVLFRQKIEEIGIKSASNFKDEYIALREVVMRQDKHKVMNTLNRCQVNGRMLWLCETHRKARRSKTEIMYDQLNSEASNIPIGEVPDGYEAPQPEEPPISREEKRPHRKVFRHESGMKPRPVKRQTSQMCSVM